MNSPVKIGVIAGTPVDTEMGVDFVKKHGFEAIGYATACSPEEQNRLQFLEPEYLTQKVIDIIRDFETQSIYRTMIYCNSLSSAIDIKFIRSKQPNSIIVTPLDIYQNLATKYNKITIWAANGQCLSTIEYIFYKQNPAIDIMGMSMLPVIKAIEERKPPATIIDKFDLISLGIERFDADCLILGCTHLPYLQAELSKRLTFPIIDPALEMLKLLTSSCPG
ncbi:MAG TPA: aspartate/glutamate racemase family protein [Thermoanaerobacterales bacterium]|uniref:aspartate/glutamate racemase family protein n=1 Tax=Tepidanaerobacter sp. GT38 TaxID=2722793 RepID=UPI00184C453A|nr:aspartate/glutamate racemase family protein [Tepidanaerobacter sp. GT38]MCG1013056.1 Asp/Glu racemase [Tepidanaerobacter sp. GT38]HHY42888.1 aspartate/glutamate racemase family protein [Thermoanaerobacterales bacterium]